MTHDEAKEIMRLLLDTVRAMSSAEAAIIRAGSYNALADHLDAIANNLNWGLVPAIYQQFPDLQPPGEVPTINSELEWEGTDLPSSITESELDEMILSLLQPRWRKVASILVGASKQCEARSWPIDVEVVAVRIRALAEDNQIDHQGDLRMWRFSEVRLKPQLKLLP